MLPKLVIVKYQGQLSGCKFNERAMASALENYRTDSGGAYPSTLEPIITQRYINFEPHCPSSNDTYDYTTDEIRSNYTISCKGWHWKVLNNITQGFPQYNPTIGLLDRPLP